MHSNTKYWSLTWNTNIKQKTLPNENALISFFDRIADEGVFQYEKGAQKEKEHIQGTFTLSGVRQSKTSVLKLFAQSFKNVGGLTISPVYDKIAIKSYVTKDEGRLKGPFYGGKKEMYDKQMATYKLRMWQEQLFKIITGSEQEALRDRKVIWVQDTCGNTGKSWFQKWLRIGQKRIVVRSLPVSNVDRLISAVNIINRTLKVDAYTIDLTRTQGEDQSYKDLFSVIEQIKNGYVIDVMYGKYNECIFQPPLVIIFTNNRFEEFSDYLSNDRWEVYVLGAKAELRKRVSPCESISFEDLERINKIRNELLKQFPNLEDSGIDAGDKDIDEQ